MIAFLFVMMFSSKVLLLGPRSEMLSGFQAVGCSSTNQQPVKRPIVIYTDEGSAFVHKPDSEGLQANLL